MNKSGRRSKLIIAREISWLSFNARVLQEANDPTVPLKSRIRFLGIYSNNRDEFFRRRMAAVKQLILASNTSSKKFSQDQAQHILDQIYSVVVRQQHNFNDIWKKTNEELKKKKIFLVDDKQLTAKQKKFAQEYFDQEVSSTIIPLFIESMPHWPSYRDENIFLGIVMKKTELSNEQKFAVIEIPTKNNPRFIFLPSAPGEHCIMLLEDLIRFNLPKIFLHLGYTYFEAHMFKVTKDAEFDVDVEDMARFVQKIEKGIKNRRKAIPISFLYDQDMNKALLDFLIKKLNLSQRNIIIPAGKIRNFRDFMDFPALLPNEHPRPPPLKHPLLAKALRVSDLILKQDVLLHLPYHSFNSIIELLCEAAMDKDVRSIKITAYRLADNSKICNALINAARTGKQVHVVLELRAYFDEYANLEWKQKLEDEGVKVFLGVPHMKVHAKLCVIKKQIGQRILQYGFIGTGNLNERTAQSYADHFLLTSDRVIITDINRIFRALEFPENIWQQLSLCKTLLVSPVNMRPAISQMIDREIYIARSGKPAKIIININSLSDDDLILQLYRAAEAGVEINMIIRGVFCAETERKEFKKPMTAISIVDEYLEHSRIFYFHNGGTEEIYISSADWKKRNLDHRIEVAVPIKDKAIKDELKHILKIKLNDNVKARKLDKELSNTYISPAEKKKVRSQLAIYQYLKHKRYKP